MGRYKLLITTFTALDTIWDASLHLAAIRLGPQQVTYDARPLQTVDCDIHSVGHDMVLECCSRPSRLGPHQVTYAAVAWLMRI
eukprot:scaffold11309_cov126-Skeletonema_dohrnii-CCMP3373.AAC.9